MTAPTSVTTLVSMAVVAALIVLIAGINYVNLMGARAVQRAVEVGIRKAAGGRRRDLMLQFLGESVVYTALATLLGIALVECLLPYFNAYTDAHLAFAYWRNGVLLAILVAVPLFVGLLTGFYPALVLSAFPPTFALKGGPSRTAGRDVIRTALVILQFSILIAIAIVAVTVERQSRYALLQSLRVPADQILQVHGGCDEGFEARVRQLAGVKVASCAAMRTLSDTTVQSADGTPLTYRESPVDFDFFKAYGIKPLAGRIFTRAYGADAPVADAPAADTPAGAQPNIVINETAARELGFSTPQAAIGKTVRWQRNDYVRRAGQPGSNATPSTVIGVVPDFSLQGPREKVPPQLYIVDRSAFDTLSVRLDGQRIPETLAAIDRLWNALGKDKPIEREFLDQALQRQYADVVREGAIFGALSALALLLACTGLYALAAFTTERRTREIGVRKAMGASSADVLRLLVWKFVRPVLWANLLAWPVAYWCASRWLNGFAYHVELSIWLFVAASAAAALIAVAAVLGQGIRAARARPVVALRYE